MLAHVLENFEESLVEDLCEAAFRNKPAEIKEMLTLPCYVAVVNRNGARGLNACYTAAREGHSEVLFHLLSCPLIDVNQHATAQHKGTPLHGASQNLTS